MKSNKSDLSLSSARVEGHLDMVDAGLKAAIDLLAASGQPEMIADLNELRSSLKACRSSRCIQARERSQKGRAVSDVLPDNPEALERLKPKLARLSETIDSMSEDEYGQWVDDLPRDEFFEFMRAAHDGDALGPLLKAPVTEIPDQAGECSQ
ncbi:hypothetical protein [Pseudomonas sp. NPDC096950]|uniref:hypothetical protein n=1 Tax=Pseudomonas sp. NPDC096950 TaxID=3364485 RepID=UPI00383B54B9